jgi:SNF2 family DNA or RNA helicase
MPNRSSKSGSELFIVDNSDVDWKVQRYLRDWCQISKQIDIATGYFEIGSLLSLEDVWQEVDSIRILMGDQVSLRTKKAFEQGLLKATQVLDASIESEKEKNDFLAGVPAIVEGIRNGKIACRVYRKDKFHAKAYITHGRMDVVGASALVGSSNFTYPGLTKNIELNVQITGRPVSVLQEWYEEHWEQAEEVTEDILQTIERHTREYSPFEVYARSLQEYFRSHEMTVDEWEQRHSAIYPMLATYQKRGYQGMLKRARTYQGAFLCDGVGLGKTYIGLMLIERLVQKERLRTALFVPKGAVEPVWRSRLRKLLPDVLYGGLGFKIFSHTDLLRKGDIQHELDYVRRQYDCVIIDEAHHFRNTGVRGEGQSDRRSRYWEMYDICDGKQVFMLTATPVNNRLTDFQHMVELFSQRQPDFFASRGTLGIHSLPGHVRKLEKQIEKEAEKQEESRSGEIVDLDETPTDLAEAEEVLRTDELFEELVVQRSRAYVKDSLAEEDENVLFPKPSMPKVVPYSVKQTYGKLLGSIDRAFHKSKPLFSLAMYYPYEDAFYKGDMEELKAKDTAWQVGRQKQVVQLIRTSFLKRFESSVEAFRASCRTLMKKLIAFYLTHAHDKKDRENLERWLIRNADITGWQRDKSLTLFGDELTAEELAAEDVVESEFFEEAYEKRLDPDEFEIPALLRDTVNDLDTIIDFLNELGEFQPKQDKKLQALIQLLRGHTSGLGDVVLQRGKILIFTEFKDTARYVAQQLREAGFDGVAEIDSENESRMDVIERFAPYYNDSSTADLEQRGLDEIRILISTDVLSEGLNLQDATRLINYDLHWNPVRLMQRIGRIDRRLDREIEARIIADHPDREKDRGTIQYYNFLPPEELNELLSLYRKVTHKTLRISKTFGIENGKLLRPDDDYEILRDFVQKCEGSKSKAEQLSLELQRLTSEHPELLDRVTRFPNRVFSGKEALSPNATGVFFCYARPARDADSGGWTLEAGDVKWYLYDLATDKIIEDPYEIADHIRSTPETVRVCRMDADDLIDIRKKLDKHVKNTYLRKVQAPAGVKPVLRTWMELNA